MSEVFVRKLGSFVRLDQAEETALRGLCAQSVAARAGEDLIREGERPRHVHLLLSGWAYRYKLLPDGGRQIMAYLVPGDLADTHVFILEAMDHNIGLLSDAEVGLIPEDAMTGLRDRYPRIERALSWSTLVDAATLREWLVNTLRRDPLERVAHLLCELRVRLGAVGLVEGNAFDLPLTQAELGDTVGLNAVTINRVLQRLRGESLITLAGGRADILDGERLARIGGFDPGYLHLRRRN